MRGNLGQRFGAGTGDVEETDLLLEECSDSDLIGGIENRRSRAACNQCRVGEIETREARRIGRAEVERSNARQV